MYPINKVVDDVWNPDGNVKNTSDFKLNSPSFESWIRVGFRFTNEKDFEQFRVSIKA